MTTNITVKEKCAESVLSGGFLAFQALLDDLQYEIPQEDLVTVITFASTYFGVNTAGLAQFTGGNPETNTLWPSEPLTEEEVTAIWNYLMAQMDVALGKLLIDTPNLFSYLKPKT